MNIIDNHFSTSAKKKKNFFKNNNNPVQKFTGNFYSSRNCSLIVKIKKQTNKKT